MKEEALAHHLVSGRESPLGGRRRVSWSTGGGWKSWAASSPLTPLWWEWGVAPHCSQNDTGVRLPSRPPRTPAQRRVCEHPTAGETGCPGSLEWGEFSLQWGRGRRPHSPHTEVHQGDWLFTSRSGWNCRPRLGLCKCDGMGNSEPCSRLVTLRLPLDLSCSYPGRRGRKTSLLSKLGFLLSHSDVLTGGRGHVFCCCVWLEMKG